jgi:hypothetical protein
MTEGRLSRKCLALSRLNEILAKTDEVRDDAVALAIFSA